MGRMQGESLPTEVYADSVAVRKFSKSYQVGFMVNGDFISPGLGRASREKGERELEYFSTQRQARSVAKSILTSNIDFNNFTRESRDKLRSLFDI